MPRVTFQCNQRFLSHVSEIFIIYKSKILAVLQTLIKAPQHHQKSKKIISRTCEKGFLWKLVGLSRMLPVTFQHNPTQINRCKKKLFFLVNQYFHPQIRGRACTCWKERKKIDFANMWKRFSIKIGELVEDDYT